MKRELLVGLMMVMTAGSGLAQWKATAVKDASVLKPPAGSKVAVVEFMDLQCPVCAQVSPVVETTAKQRHVAVVHHDFPLPMHNWSFAAAVNARFFDSKSQELGNAYRSAVFANQDSIDNVPSLTQFTQKFAQDHKVELPFLMDPGDKFANEVKADRDLARRMELQRTPTIFVVAQTASGPQYAELLDRNGLNALIDQEMTKARTK